MTDRQKQGKNGKSAEAAQSYYFEGYYDSASFMPADTDRRVSAQGGDGSVPPAFPPHESEEKNGKGTFRIILIAAVLLIALFCMVFVVQVAMSYELAVTNDNGSISFVFSKRDAAQDKGELQILPLEGIFSQLQSDGDQNSSSDAGGQDSAGNFEYGAVTLHISAAVDFGRHMTFQQIYERCADSIVMVVSKREDQIVSASGIVMTEDGYIITSSYIASAGGETIVVLPSDMEEYEAVVVGRDDATDIAVLKIAAAGLTPAEFGDSGELKVGDAVAVIGNTSSGTTAISDGIVSAIDKNASYNGYSIALILTSAAMNEGTSGGAIISCYGQIVGIADFHIGQDMGYPQGMNCAIPIGAAKKVIDELLKYGYVSGRPALGISIANVPAAASAYYGLPMGVFVGEAAENGSAYAQGIRRGDIIVSINGTAITNTDEFNEIKNSCSVGDTVTLGIYRQRELYSVDVVLMDSADMS